MSNSPRIQVLAKRRQQKRRYIIFMILWLMLIGLSAWLSTHLPKQWDISREKRFSITQDSQDLLALIDGDIKFTAFAGNDPNYRKDIRHIIEQYQQHKASITLEFIDPSQRPDLTRQYGIKQHGEIRISLIKSDGESTTERSDILRRISETTISNALQRLSRDKERYILFLEGHGERDPFSKANHDLIYFAAELEKKGFALQTYNLSQSPRVPNNATFLVLASPQLNYLPQEIQRLQNYIIQGGNLLWLMEPDGIKGLDSLLVTLGLHTQSGTVIDPSTQALNISDASFSIVNNYNQHPAFKDFNLVTLLPQSRAFELLPMDTLWQISPLLISSNLSWLETDTLEENVSFSADADIKGPHNLGMSLTRNVNNKQQRIIVLGDGDFLSNRFLNNGANLTFGLNTFDWLSGEEDFLDIQFSETPDEQLNLDEQQLAWLGLIFLMLIPALCFLIAARLWWVRRNG